MRKHLNWQYLSNQFDAVTKNSYPKLDVLAKDHLTKLDNRRSSNQQVDQLYLGFQQAYQIFSAAYNAWQNSEDVYNSLTAQLDALLEQLSSEKLEDWRLEIQRFYRRHTIEYKRLFFNGGTDAFHRGKKDLRIRRVKRLAQSLATDSNFGTLHAEVMQFYNDLEAARTAQQKQEQEVQHLATQLRGARERVVKLMHRNLGMLLYVHWENLEDVLNYFQMDLIRNTTSSNSIISGFREIVTPEGQESDSVVGSDESPNSDC